MKNSISGHFFEFVVKSQIFPIVWIARSSKNRSCSQPIEVGKSGLFLVRPARSAPAVRVVLSAFLVGLTLFFGADSDTQLEGARQP